MFIGVAVVLIAFLGLVYKLFAPRHGLNLQAMHFEKLTDSGKAAQVGISPDGRYIVYVLRAGEVIAGEERVADRRPAARPRDYARGPARLCVALGIDRELNGTDLTRRRSPLRLEPGEPVPPAAVMTGPRVGVSSVADRPWRYWIAGDPTVSSYRPHVPKRRR